MMIFRLGVLLGMSALIVACGSPAAPGEANGKCYPNGTCNSGLECQSGRCITAREDKAEPAAERPQTEETEAREPEADSLKEAVKRDVEAKSAPKEDSLSESGAQMVVVPGGNFARGHATGSWKEQPVRSVFVSEFKMDRYEVTVEDYEKCVEAGVCSVPGSSSQYCSASFEYARNWGKADRKRHPVNCVNWSAADKYCRWAGKRLPTEAEWEKAARGREGRIFAWGNDTPSCRKAVIRADGGPGCGSGHTAPVGSKPAGATPLGIMDMTGNVAEWVSDKYSERYYARGPVDNPKGAAGSSKNSVRGGSYYNPMSFQKAFSRDARAPSNTYAFIGFRCAK